MHLNLIIMRIPATTSRSRRSYRHVVQDTENSLHLRCTSLWGEYIAKGIGSLVCGLFLAIGLRQLLFSSLSELATVFGLAATVLGGGGLFAVWQDDWSGSAFDAQQQIAVLKDTRKTDSVRVVFDRIQQVQVRSGGRNQFSLSIVEVLTEQGKYTLVEGWEMWRAEDLAQRIGALVQCPVINVHGQRLPTIRRTALVHKPNVHRLHSPHASSPGFSLVSSHRR